MLLYNYKRVATVAKGLTMCKCVANMTKKQQKMLWRVGHSENETLYDVYKTFSQEKYLAYERCKGEMYRKNGFNFRITSKNTFLFTCGFLYYDENKHLKCRYFTAQNVYDFLAE